MLAIAVVAIVGAWVQRAQQQRVAVKALVASNPNALVAYELGACVTPALVPDWNTWIDERLGIDYFQPVMAIALTYPTDADLEFVARLPSVRQLHLRRAIDLTDAGLAQLAELERLESLTLDDAGQLTDRGLRQLGRIATLRELNIDLGRRAVSREVLEELRAALPNCRIRAQGSESTAEPIARHTGVGRRGA